jgi:Flp pilus assembly protein TadG
VEFAVVGSTFFLIVLGIFELGRAIMVRVLLFNAARIGARVGTIEGTSSTNVTDAVNDYLSGSGISGDTATVYVNDQPVTSGGSGSDPVQNAKAGDEITVLVAVPVSKVTWLPFTNYLTNDSVAGQFTLRRE